MERVVVEGQIEIDNIGECVVSVNNDFGEFWFLMITTKLGWTDLIDYGPVVPDMDVLSPNFSINYSRFEFNQQKIEKLIDKFLNNPKRAITQAEVTTIENICELFVDPVKKVFGDKFINNENETDNT